ncbi:hypothetical protein QBC37DRAFT_421225 [Rhypophila decipiens]|uniref:Uncharacterized protein n=1 Tax=Rhypophila decipiens TaxID=261697 RepID=A0AAN6YAS4_9PEZI|nr:hypothetical protein QBC37DRAFT_421225 [Rhypophila decipiens]
MQRRTLSPPSRVDGSQLFNLITEANGQLKAARESQNLNHGRNSTAYLRTLTKAAEYFPQGTFSAELGDKAGFFQEDSLHLHTELCWALSGLPRDNNGDWPQMAVHAYEGLQNQVYNMWYHGFEEQKEKREFTEMVSRVTNELAKAELITKDTAPREGLVNSPRQGMGRVAFLFTYALNLDHKSSSVMNVERDWRQRCGDFNLHLQ